MLTQNFKAFTKLFCQYTFSLLICQFFVINTINYHIAFQNFSLLILTKFLPLCIIFIYISYKVLWSCIFYFTIHMLSIISTHQLCEKSYFIFINYVYFILSSHQLCVISHFPVYQLYCPTPQYTQQYVMTAPIYYFIYIEVHASNLIMARHIVFKAKYCV